MPGTTRATDYPRYWAVVPAAGAGSRMRSEVPKQYLPLAGKTVLEHTLLRLLSHRLLSGVVVALSPEDSWWADVHIVSPTPLIVVQGGVERCYSVLNALLALRDYADADDWVLVHDAARPCLTHGDIDLLISELSNHPVGGILGLRSVNTKKRTDASGTIVETVCRERLWRAFTPQMFRFGMLLEAMQRALAANVLVTDESSAIEWAGHAPRMIEGRSDNIKITVPDDLVLAEIFIRHQEGQSCG